MRRFAIVVLAAVLFLAIFGCASPQQPSVQGAKVAQPADVPAKNVTGGQPAVPPVQNISGASHIPDQQAGAPPPIPGQAKNASNSPAPPQGQGKYPAPVENESFAVALIPPGVENNCVGFLVGAQGEIATAAKAGAGMVRPHPGPFAWGWIEKQAGNYDFGATDEFAFIAGGQNEAILATVWPFADWDQTCSQPCEVNASDQFYPRQSFGIAEGIPLKRCKPCDMPAYKKFLSALVERYDGDGKGDMPGLKIPIKYYEILNEPEMRSDGLTFFKGSAQDYVDILAASNEAIKAACPDCKVVQAGAAGNDEQSLSFWREAFAKGAGQYFDIANIHYIAQGDKATLNVAQFRGLMSEYGIDKPIWVTEAEYAAGDSVTPSFEGALSAGASKVFFTRFEIGKKGPPTPGVYSAEYSDLPAKCPG